MSSSALMIASVKKPIIVPPSNDKNYIIALFHFQGVNELLIVSLYEALYNKVKLFALLMCLVYNYLLKDYIEKSPI